jgi:hypothetical protein
MAFRVRSSDRDTERRRATVVQTVVLVCALLCPIPQGPAALRNSQAKPSGETTERFRFRVSDSENDLPISGAVVYVVYWQKLESGEEKKEIELKTDEKGIAEFAKVEADKFAVTVAARGYRPFWHWIRPTETEKLIRIRLEKWPSAPK